MIDLTNKTVDEINATIQKYSSVLELFVKSRQEYIPILAYVFDMSVNYINKHHENLTADWKIWTVIVVKKYFFQNKIKTETDIGDVINDFIKYFEDEYQNYCDGLGIYENEYHRDYGFVKTYLIK